MSTVIVMISHSRG